MKVARKVGAKKAPAKAAPTYRGGRLGSISKFKESVKQGGGGAGYVWTIADGVTATVRFLTEPDDWHELYQHYDQTVKSYFTCVGRENGCQYCEEGDRPGFKYLANVVDMADKRVRALGIPRSVAEILLKRLNNNKTLMDRDYEISRDGSTMENTKYDVDYKTPRPMNPKKFDLLDLDAIIRAQLPGAGSSEDEDDEDEDEDFLPPKKAKRRSTIVDDDDDEDEEERPARRAAKKAVGRKVAKAASSKRKFR